MDPRKLSPAVLLALGLHGCQCEEQHVGPCLSFVPADPPDDPPDPPIGPCLDTLPPEPPVGPCLTPLPPDPPEPPIGPCLEPPLEPPEPRNHPCLSIAPPQQCFQHPATQGGCLIEMTFERIDRRLRRIVQLTYQLVSLPPLVDFIQSVT